MLKLKKIYRKVLRYNIVKKYKKNIQNKNFTIISSNCIGGLIYHDLGMQFKSPTINMYIKANDFIKLCKNLKKYMDEELIEIKDNIYKFPIAKLGDIYLYCVHYKNFNDVYNKWNKRKKRINYNNIYIIMSDRDGCTDENIKEFDELDYKNKVIFVHKRMDNIKSSYYIKGTENNDKRNRIINITEYKGKFTGKRYYEDFDFVTFLNNRGV